MTIDPVVLDSACWIAWFTAEPIAVEFGPYIRRPDLVYVPAIVQFEVYRWALRNVGEERAGSYAAALKQCRPVRVDESLAHLAAELSVEHGLPLADAFVYATGVVLQVPVLTMDGDLERLPGVRFFPKPGRSDATRKARRAKARETPDGS